jgi:hypothetical protein
LWSLSGDGGTGSLNDDDDLARNGCNTGQLAAEGKKISRREEELVDVQGGEVDNDI